MFTIIDIETTGLSKKQNEITEIAAVKFHSGEIIDSFQTLVNPQVKIPSLITKLTGIDNKMVKFSPTIKKVLPSFISFLDKDIFVAHNAEFDFGFLEHNLMVHHNHRLLNKQLCTKKLANHIYPELPRKRLKDLCEHLDIQNTQAHRAMADVLATTKIFENMLSILKSKQITSINDIVNFEKSPLSFKRKNYN